MPEICRFYGITIRMYFADHNPPHFHAYYGEHEAIIDLATLAVLAGSLPGRALGMVVEWAACHQDDLLNLWQRAQAGEKLEKLPPLD